MAIQIKRGTEAQRSAVTFKEGELVFVTDKKELYIGDGSTAGGIKLFEKLYTAEAAAKVDFLTVTGAVDLDALKTTAGNAVAKTDIIDDLTTGGADKVLSAEQGKALKGLIDAMAGGLQYKGVFDIENGQELNLTTTPEINGTSVKKGDFYLINCKATNGEGELSDGTNKFKVNTGDMVIFNKDVEKTSIQLPADIDKIDNTESDDILRTANISTAADFTQDQDKLVTRKAIKDYVEAKLGAFSTSPITKKNQLIVGNATGDGEAVLDFPTDGLASAFKVLRISADGNNIEWGDVDGGSF